MGMSHAAPANDAATAAKRAAALAVWSRNAHRLPTLLLAECGPQQMSEIESNGSVRLTSLSPLVKVHLIDGSSGVINGDVVDADKACSRRPLTSSIQLSYPKR